MDREMPGTRCPHPIEGDQITGRAAGCAIPHGRDPAATTGCFSRAFEEDLQGSLRAGALAAAGSTHIEPANLASSRTPRSDSGTWRAARSHTPSGPSRTNLRSAPGSRLGWAYSHRAAGRDAPFGYQGQRASEVQQ